MKLNIDTPMLRPWLRALEPSLPMLATRAAVELDAQRLGKSCDMQAVRELSALLKNSLDQNVGEGTAPQTSSLLDPATMVIVGRALQTIPERRVTKVAELEPMLREVADWLDRSAASVMLNRVEVLRDFCLALARGASSHRQDFRNERTTNPYRR